MGLQAIEHRDTGTLAREIRRDRRISWATIDAAGEHQGKHGEPPHQSTPFSHPASGMSDGANPLNPATA